MVVLQPDSGKFKRIHSILHIFDVEDKGQIAGPLAITQVEQLAAVFVSRELGACSVVVFLHATGVRKESRVSSRQQ